MPSADELIAEWPQEAIAKVAPDHQTAIVVLTHDDKFDEPALIAALETEAFYIGALGSRRNQERRRERLLEAGVEEEKLERIAGPCGLDIGADTQEETALSILAEILAVRAKREGGPLRDGQAADPRRGGVTGARFAGCLRSRRALSPPDRSCCADHLQREQWPQHQLAQSCAPRHRPGGPRRGHRDGAGSKDEAEGRPRAWRMPPRRDDDAPRARRHGRRRPPR